MPVCTTCTHWLPYLYTVYSSAYNLRLEQCPNCHSFADPYVEHDELKLLIDLLLLKRAVYRHLLYNRGSDPRRETPSTPSATESENEDEKGQEKKGLDERELSRWRLVLRLGLTCTFVDAFIRWSVLSAHPDNSLASPANSSPWSIKTISGFARIFLGCSIETIAFHVGIVFASNAVLRIMLQFWQEQSSIRREFRFSLIPLTLFYSSFTKLFFLFLLTIWRPSRVAQPPPSSSASTNVLFSNLGMDILRALEWMTDDNLDREWTIRNVLGGMSAGFGLRVILDMHPFFTTLIILFGWASKTLMSQLISGWMASGGSVATPEAWLASSIP